MFQKIRPAFWIAAAMAVTFEASADQFQQSSYDSALGKSLGGAFQTGVQPSENGSAESTILLTVLDSDLQALQATSVPPSTAGGAVYNEVYAFGKRIFDQSEYFHANATSFTAGVAPTEIRVPVFGYTVGPIAIQVDGGARFQADVQGQALIGIGTPASFSTLGVQLNTSGDGAGFIEGYTSLLAIRGGVGGQVDLVDADAELNASYFFNGNKPLVTIDAMVDFLKGNFYAFIDYFNVVPMAWKRWVNYDLYAWKGSCHQIGSKTCP